MRRKLRIAIDVGHINKRSRPFDKGAVYKGVYEADIAFQYAYRAYDRIMRSLSDKVKVFFPLPARGILVGDYWERRKFCDENLVDLYIQCHLNAGRGNYGLVLTVLDKPALDDLELEMGRLFVRIMEKETGIRYKDWDGDKDKVQVLNQDDRGYSVLRKADFLSYILEPAFIDNPKHFKALLEGDLILRISNGIYTFVKKFVEMKGS